MDRNSWWLALAVVAGLLAGAARGQSPPVFGSRGVRAHDPSTIVRCKDEYWLFYTGRGVPSYRSKDLCDWQPGPPVFVAAPDWVAATVPGMRSTLYYWAPDVVRVGERYLVYYSASTFGQNTSAIGLATSATLDPADTAYGWTDQGIVVQTGAADDFNAIDPAVVLDGGKLWLAFGSYWTGIKLVELDPATGKRAAPDSPLHALARNSSIEAAYIFRRGDAYYLFVNFGQCCQGTRSTYNVRVGRSSQITGPYVDRAGQDLLHGGGTLLLETAGAFIGPGHVGILADGDRQWLSCHFYDGTRRGIATLAIRPLTWDADGWPVVGTSEPAAD